MTIKLDEFNEKSLIVSIVSGGAKGADQLVKRYAQEKEVRIEIFKPDWARHGEMAESSQTEKIIATADNVIVFWDGGSLEELNSIHDCAKKNEKGRACC